MRRGVTWFVLVSIGLLYWAATLWAGHPTVSYDTVFELVAERFPRQPSDRVLLEYETGLVRRWPFLLPYPYYEVTVTLTDRTVGDLCQAEYGMVIDGKTGDVLRVWKVLGLRPGRPCNSPYEHVLD